MTVEPEDFDAAMTDHWQRTLGNVPSEALKAVWKQMASTFNRQIRNHGTPEGDRWKILQPPTGSGKSQGLAVYCALLGRNTLILPNKGFQEGCEGICHPGVLIVTRLITQADDLVKTINTIAGSETAKAHHSNHRLTPEEMRETPVLVITHAAYENGLDALNRYEDNRSGTEVSWNKYHSFGDGIRKLTVIDEALDIVQEAQFDLSKVKVVRAVIPFEVGETFPRQMDALETVESLLIRMARVSAQRATEGQAESERLLWSGKQRMPDSYDMTELRRAIMGLPLDRLVLGREDTKERQKLRTRYSTILQDVQTALDSWIWYAKKMNEHTINTARLIVPDEMSGAVVMDATASSNLIYQLFDTKADLVPVPDGVRRYSNVTLHVSRGHAVGKTSMTKGAREEAPKLVSNLMNSIGADRKVFVCCHKYVEPHLVAMDTGFSAFDVGHWNAIDGRNDWQDYDTAVIYGLLYRDNTWSANTFMALRGVQDSTWLNADGDRPFRHHTDIRHALEVGQLVVSIVQAVNRVRCRRVIDSHGNCPSTDVFILLPSDKTGDEILAGIQREMPGIQVSDWQYDDAKRKPKRSNYVEALVRYAAVMGDGRRSSKDVREHLGISSSQWERLSSLMSDPESPLSIRLQAHNARYLVEGKGRGARSYLIKG